MTQINPTNRTPVANSVTPASALPCTSPAEAPKVDAAKAGEIVGGNLTPHTAKEEHFDWEKSLPKVSNAGTQAGHAFGTHNAGQQAGIHHAAEQVGHAHAIHNAGEQAGIHHAGQQVGQSHAVHHAGEQAGHGTHHRADVGHAGEQAGHAHAIHHAGEQAGHSHAVHHAGEQAGQNQAIHHAGEQAGIQHGGAHVGQHFHPHEVNIPVNVSGHATQAGAVRARE